MTRKVLTSTLFEVVRAQMATGHSDSRDLFAHR